MADKISIIIPNYNGKELLQKNLPVVIKNSKNCEIVVVDDCSSDRSVMFIKKNYKKIKVISHSKNEGFAKSVNDGVKAAAGNLVVLLNSDVAPRANFLIHATEQFKKDNLLFGVALADYSHENKRTVVRGRGGGVFQKGFLNHFAAKTVTGSTLWLSGGSAIIDKNKFLEIYGFDQSFSPFYWEDIDLSFRAWRNGWHCVFEPRSKVDHFHEEGSIKKSKSPLYIKTASYKNQFIFVWKNISDPLLITLHFLWLPYHLFKAVIKVDLSFIAGFFWAVIFLPKLIFSQQIDYKIAEKEVLKKFEKLERSLES